MHVFVFGALGVYNIDSYNQNGHSRVELNATINCKTNTLYLEKHGLWLNHTASTVLQLSHLYKLVKPDELPNNEH